MAKKGDEILRFFGFSLSGIFNMPINKIREKINPSPLFETIHG